MNPLQSCRDISQTSPKWSVPGKCGIRLSFLSSELCAPPSNPKQQFPVKQPSICFYNNAEGFLSVFWWSCSWKSWPISKIFYGRKCYISDCLTWCVLPTATVRVVWLLAFLKARLNPIAFFVWDNFLSPLPLWMYKLGRRVRHDQVTDAPGCCAFSCRVYVSMERETAETTLQWITADSVLCFFCAQLTLIYWWRVIRDVKSKGWTKPLTHVSSALAFTGNQKLKAGEKHFLCV